MMNHYGNDPPQQVFLGMRAVGSQRINDKDQGNTQNGCQNILGHIEDGICSFLRFVRYLRKAADFQSALCFHHLSRSQQHKEDQQGKDGSAVLIHEVSYSLLGSF